MHLIEPLLTGCPIYVHGTSVRLSKLFLQAKKEISPRIEDTVPYKPELFKNKVFFVEKKILRNPNKLFLVVLQMSKHI